MAVQIPSGFGMVQPSQPRSMLEVYLATKKGRQDAKMAAAQEARAAEEFQFKRNQEGRAQNAETRAEGAASREEQEFEQKRFESFLRAAEPAIRDGNLEVVDELSARYGIREDGQNTTPEGLQQLQGMLADPEAGLTADLQTFEGMTEGLSEEEQDKARRIELGLAPRAVGDAKITLASGAAGVTPEQVGDASGIVKSTEDANKQAIEMSGKAMEKLQGVRKSVTNIDNAIAAIDKGANTGAIASRLPSVQAASVELDNIRGQMGIDVLGAVTFGALSEGELAFALSTAMPDNLNEKELRKWLVRKKEAQEKLADELEGAAIFLGTPGNTPAKYLEYMKNQGALEFQKEKNQDEAVISNHPVHGDITEADIQRTMRENGMSREQVLQQLQSAR